MPVSLVELSRLRHDLRSPLGQIVGFGEMLMEEAELAQARPLLPPLRLIQQLANDALRAVNDSLGVREGGLRPEEVQGLSCQLQKVAASILESVATLRELAAAGCPESLLEDLQRVG